MSGQSDSQRKPEIAHFRALMAWFFQCPIFSGTVRWSLGEETPWGVVVAECHPVWSASPGPVATPLSCGLVVARSVISLCTPWGSRSPEIVRWGFPHGVWQTEPVLVSMPLEPNK